jgi:hypothetical protein
MSKRLKTLSDIRRYFHRSQRPIYFVGATNFNLIGMDEWFGNFSYINYIDCFDGQHPNVFVPKSRPDREFKSIEEISNYLLEHKETVDFIRARGHKDAQVVFLFFDEESEKLAKALGLEVCFPAARLRQAVDNKIEATRIGERAGVRSVPNVLCKIESYGQLRKAARRLGEDLVIQTAFGDSGHTTFFVSSEKDFDRHRDEIVAEPEVKVMKRIRCRGSAIEACVTRHGTLVGPLMTELIGFPQLTPYKGGWCGNEVYADAFDPAVRRRARKMTFAFGEELRRLGYRGYFELDFLMDEASGRLYLGEVNPRITGASAMTNLAAFAHADAPLFLFHMLEFAGVSYDLDVDTLNRRWSDADNIDAWGQLVIKYPRDEVGLIASAPASGVWTLGADGMRYERMQTHRRTVRSEDQAFFLRIAGPGDYHYKGADLGILITRGRMMDGNKLTPRAERWLSAVHGQYALRKLPRRAEPVAPTTFKLL